jgi:hypothetical protein
MATTTEIGVQYAPGETRPVATVFSVYMDNIDAEVLRYQKLCVQKFLPANWDFNQVHAKFDRHAHPNKMEECTEYCPSNVIVFLDIDCIPLTDSAFPTLYEKAERHALVGAVQRANHIENGQHLYAGPFCMAFNKYMYYALGSPTFRETTRGDVGEELTYVWDKYKHEVQLLLPTAVQEPLWNLVGNMRFGHGTTYANKFYHAFESRVSAHRQSAFIDRCKQVLA